MVSLRRPRGDCAGGFPKPGAWALVMLSLIVATSIALPQMSATSPPSWGAFDPDGGEILAGGSYYDIRWNATHGVDPTLFVTIDLIGWGFVTAGDFPTGGAVWKWHVPTVDIPSARIRACAVAYDGSRGCRESSANFSVVMAPPYVGILSPADGAENVSLDAPIILAFDPPPDPSTFQLPIILPPVPLLSVTWNGDAVLVLQHYPFAECTVYAVLLNYPDPSPDPTVWRFTTVCPLPRVLDFGFVAAVNGSLSAAFNKPMDRLETYATISPEVPLTATWNANNTYVTLRPSPSFEPCTIYTAQLFGGKDLLGNPGVVEPGPIPNPFSFTTECLSPVTPDLTDTNPADATVDVPIIAPLFVNFSRSMDTASVRADFSPVVTATYTWTNNNISLRLNHETLFAECTGYTVIVSGNDMNGDSLGPGRVPNPWSFSTVC